MPNPHTQGAESITQAEHLSPSKTGDNIEAKRVANYRYALNGWVRDGLELTERYDSQGTTIYAGSALVGTAEGTTGAWQIVKYDLADLTSASGKVATDVSWTNRASGTYT